MTNLPDKIYLQVGDDTEQWHDFNELDGVSWHYEKVFDNDIEYVRIDADYLQNFLKFISDEMVIEKEGMFETYANFMMNIQSRL